VQREKEKEKKVPKESWKGMPLGMEEYWINGWSGRFRVSRRNTSSEYSISPRKLRSYILF
jgi:hypothetical protein